MATEEVLFPSLYEENYILRSLGSIVTQPDIALTELIANAWDAGASTVNIAIPENTGQILYIEDDGTGMSEEEFQNRWMKLRYDRLRTQGRKVVFPDGSDKNRYAFGRNGVGQVASARRLPAEGTRTGGKIPVPDFQGYACWRELL